LAVDTNPPGRKAAVALDKYPAVPKPITVEPSCVAKYEVDTKVAKFAVDTKFAKFAVDTKPPGRIAAVALDKYPAVPNPITVEPSCVAKYEVDTKVAKFAVDTRPVRLAVLINEPKTTVEIYPTVPRPITVLVRSA
jgi:hypothetical protein